MSSQQATDATVILKYLGLAPSYDPSPTDSPLLFLRYHINQLPLQLLKPFSSLLTPRERSKVNVIRNRRVKYAFSNPDELGWEKGRKMAPDLWVESGAALNPQIGGIKGRKLDVEGEQKVVEEKEWARKEFLGGVKQHVGKISELLGEYEEERVWEDDRRLRRERAQVQQERDMVEEEEEESDEGEEEKEAPQTEEESKRIFERLLREQFIDGLLKGFDYDRIDYDEKWDPDDRDEEERWFDEEEES
jgi:hypothetical protein